MNKSTFGGANTDYTTHIALAMVVFTVFYTSVGGLPASIITDKVQAFVVMTLLVIVFLAVILTPENRITSEQFSVASNFTLDGFMAWVTLVIAILCAELFNQSGWQRVWAAENTTALRRGYFYAFPLIFFTMMAFGIFGMIACKFFLFLFLIFSRLFYLFIILF